MLQKLIFVFTFGFEDVKSHSIHVEEGHTTWFWCDISPILLSHDHLPIQAKFLVSEKTMLLETS